MPKKASTAITVRNGEASCGGGLRRIGAGGMAWWWGRRRGRASASGLAGRQRAVLAWPFCGGRFRLRLAVGSADRSAAGSNSHPQDRTGTETEAAGRAAVKKRFGVWFLFSRRSIAWILVGCQLDRYLHKHVYVDIYDNPIRRPIHFLIQFPVFALDM